LIFLGRRGDTKDRYTNFFRRKSLLNKGKILNLTFRFNVAEEESSKETTPIDEEKVPDSSEPQEAEEVKDSWDAEEEIKESWEEVAADEEMKKESSKVDQVSGKCQC
jgi:hypothetical protein